MYGSRTARKILALAVVTALGNNDTKEIIAIASQSFHDARASYGLAH
jgi:hypothetical protein